MRIGIFVALMAILIFIALFVARRRVKGVADYGMAGRSLGAWMLAFGSLAAMISAFDIAATPGMMWSLGLNGIWMEWMVPLWIGVTSFLLLSRMGRYSSMTRGITTAADFASHRYYDEQKGNNKIRILIAAAIVAQMGWYLVGQAFVLGWAVETLFGIPFLTSMWVVGGLVLIYLVFGGAFSSAWVSFLSFTVLMISALAILIFSTSHGMGTPGMVQSLASIDPFLADVGAFGPLFIVSIMLFPLFGPVVPQITDRFFTIRNPRDAARTIAIAVTFSVFFAIVTILGTYYIKTANLPLTSNNPETALFQFTRAGIFPEGLEAFIGFTFIAIICATIAPMVISISNVITHDIVNKAINKGKLDERGTLRTARIATAAVGIIVLLIASTNPSTMIAVTINSWGIVAGILSPAIFGGLWLKRATREAVFAIIITTAIFMPIWMLTPLPTLLPPMMMWMPASILAWIVFAIVSLLTPKPPKEVYELITKLSPKYKLTEADRVS